MPLRDDLLSPIPGPNPCGENLRYAPVFDKIKEARREDDDIPQGDWQHERKAADYELAIRLAGEVLANQSKDLQLAVWLTEAILKKESFSGLSAGLELIRGLIDTFWDHLYPELEDGDAELRAAPLEWLGSRMDAALRSQPIARKKNASWFRFKESRAVGLETDVDNETKREARAAAMADGKMTGEEWEEAFKATPKVFYADLETTLDHALETIEFLTALCEEKFGDAAPSFGPMRRTVEEVRHTVHGLLQKKRESEPDEETAPAHAAEAADSADEVVAEPPASWQEAVRAAAGPARPRGGTLSAEPADREDALQRVIAVAAFLRREDPANPTPYLLLRGLRFGELRAAGSDLDGNLLEAPPTETRQQLRKAANEYEWQQVLEAAEAAMAAPCGRGWLDLQRYAYRAAYEQGHYQVQAAIRAEVNALVADYPALRRAALLDDTPTANPETQAWLDGIAPAAGTGSELPAAAAEPFDSPAHDGQPDANDLALQAARAGRHQEAIEILSREVSAQRSGRGRFERRLQLAHLCISIGQERIALPILEQLAAEIDTRGLEGWEDSSLVAQPLVLLYRCLARLDAPAEARQKVYDRICRLDPLQALACAR